MRTDSHFCMQDDERATTMLQILGTTTQNLVVRGTKLPGLVHTRPNALSVVLRQC